MKRALILKELLEVENKLQKIKAMAKGQFNVENCPLKSKHHYYTELLFGKGLRYWHCEFCGECFDAEGL